MTTVEPPTVVVGATGTQGGGVVKALLQAGSFNVRAISRDAAKPVALSLQQAGAQIVEADLNDVASLEKAVTGAYGLFLVTQASMAEADTEYVQGKNAIAAAQKAGVEHFIFSALEDSRPHIQDDSAFPAVCTFQGHPSKLPHRDAKGAIKVALQQSGAPYICLYTSVFFENFMKPMLQYKKQLDGSILVIHPHGSSQSLQWHSADATGRAVAEILQNGQLHVGEDVQVATHPVSCAGAVQTVCDVTGVPVRYQDGPANLTADYHDKFSSIAILLISNVAKLSNKVDWQAQRQHMKQVGVGPSFELWAHQHKDDLIKHIDENAVESQTD